MRIVADWLDKNFNTEERQDISKKGVNGIWVFPFPEDMVYVDSKFRNNEFVVIDNQTVRKELPGFQKLPLNMISCHCNNQTIQFRVIINGQYQKIYGYLQTYDHLPRGEPDTNGYYQRSTDEEVIKYIKSFKYKIDRELKLKRILK